VLDVDLLLHYNNDRHCKGGIILMSTAKERQKKEIVALLAEGLTKREIVDYLGKSESYVYKLIREIDKETIGKVSPEQDIVHFGILLPKSAYEFLLSRGKVLEQIQLLVLQYVQRERDHIEATALEPSPLMDDEDDFLVDDTEDEIDFDEPVVDITESVVIPARAETVVPEEEDTTSEAYVASVLQQGYGQQRNSGCLFCGSSMVRYNGNLLAGKGTCEECEAEFEYFPDKKPVITVEGII